MIDDRFGFLASLIQEFEVRGVRDIRRHTGGINEQLAFRRSWLVVLVRIVLVSAEQSVLWGGKHPGAAGPRRSAGQSPH